MLNMELWKALHGQKSDQSSAKHIGGPCFGIAPFVQVANIKRLAQTI